MQVKYAIYNCATGYNRNNNDVVAQLNRETLSEHMITDGPGSGGMTPSWAGGAGQEELDRKPSEALATSRQSSWMPDFDKMFGSCVEHTKLVLAYYQICLAAR